MRPPGTAPATDKPFTASTETWTAGREGIALLEKTSTSAGNEATIELKHFSTLEPDPSLFQIPATYRIVDENGNQIAAATAHPPSAPADGAAAAGPQRVRPKPGESVFNFRPQPGLNMPVNTRAPYSVETITQTVLKQSGGTLATQQPMPATTANYRDSMGRTRADRAQAGGWTFSPNAGSSPPQPVVLPEINDPSQSMPNGGTFTIENLGTKMIDGILAMGTSNAMTMPGRSPQDPPTTNVNETWSSVQYNTVLRSTNTGPNNQTTTTAKDLSETEPDPALFQVPRDYKIVDEEGPFSITIPHPVQ